MKISVFGCGYLGAVHAACMAELGHDVVGIDVNEAKVEALNAATPPFFEPGFAELLERSRDSGRLRFEHHAKAAAQAQVHFLCVGTPQRRGENAADMSYLDAAVADLLEHLGPGDVIVGKSTVPVGTAARIAAVVAQHEPEAVAVWNPEFLREGHALADTLHPDRLVYGLPDDQAQALHAQNQLNAVYASLLEQHVPLLVTDLASAELVKVAANSFLATKISFINAMAEFCEVAGGDVVAIADAIGLDPRIGRSFLNAGLGFGGGCLPKDIRAFMARAGELGVDQALTFLREVDSINMRRRARMIDLAREELGGSILSRKVAILGAAFKPHSDDIRDSPALSVAEQMRLQGAHVVVTDPAALPSAARRYPELAFAGTVAEAVKDAEIVLLLTEWPEYTSLDPRWLGGQVRERRILDGRNALDPLQWRAEGWTYRALGRR